MTFLVVIHVVVCVFLVAVILIQPGKGDAGIGFGSASSQSIFGSRAGNFLTKVTSVVAVVYLTTSFFLTRDRMQTYNRSVIADDAPVAEAPVNPTAEKAGSEAATPADTSKAPASAPAAEEKSSK